MLWHFGVNHPQIQTQTLKCLQIKGPDSYNFTFEKLVQKRENSEKPIEKTVWVESDKSFLQDYIVYPTREYVYFYHSRT